MSLVILQPWAPFYSSELSDQARAIFAEVAEAKASESASDAGLASVRFAAELQRANGRACDSCTLCCHLISVPEIEKKAGQRCVHCAAGKGCVIYPERPRKCAGFLCSWALGEGPAEMRPDRCWCVFDYEPKTGFIRCHVHPSHPDAWRKGIVAEHIRLLHAMNRDVQIIVQNGREPPPSWGVPGIEREGRMEVRDPNTGETWCRFSLANLP